MPKKPVAEADLCKSLIKDLTARGWQCYQEVSFREQHGRADIVAVQGRVIWVVEAKTSLNLEVVAQAYQWQGHAHLVSILTPTPRVSGDWIKKRFAGVLLRDYGLGLFNCNREGEVTEKMHPAFRRAAHRNAQALIAQLREEHKTFAVAGTSGKYWTPYKESCRRLAEAVRQSPGISLKALIDQVGKLHYASPASARSTLLDRLSNGQVEGLRIERNGKLIAVFPV
jgi:hypothetical protein